MHITLSPTNSSIRLTTVLRSQAARIPSAGRNTLGSATGSDTIFAPNAETIYFHSQLTELHNKKLRAVQSEDYPAAESYKKEIDLLVAQMKAAEEGDRTDGNNVEDIRSQARSRASVRMVEPAEPEGANRVTSSNSLADSLCVFLLLLC